MKRSGPPKRRKPLKRTGFDRTGSGRSGSRDGGLRRSGLQRKTRINSVSKKRANTAPMWAEVKRFVLERDGHTCQAQKVFPHVCDGPLDPSHTIPVSRAPERRLDAENVLTVCRVAHDWIHANPDAATRLDLMGHANDNVSAGWVCG